MTDTGPKTGGERRPSPLDPGSPLNPLPGTRRYIGLDLENLLTARIGFGELIALAEPGEDTSEEEAQRARAIARIEALVRAGREIGLLTDREADVLTGENDHLAAQVARAIRWGNWPGFGPDGRRLP